MFLDYGSDKEFIVKSYVDVSFDTDLDDSKCQSRYVLNVGAISYRNLQNTYGSKCGRPVD